MLALSLEERRRKLRLVAGHFGYTSVIEMLKAYAADSVSPAICTDPGCSYATEMEPDQDQGYCEACSCNTVASALVLAGLV